MLLQTWKLGARDNGQKKGSAGWDDKEDDGDFKFEVKGAHDSLGAAVKMVENLLVSVEDEVYEYKYAQLWRLVKLRSLVVYLWN